jgi:uncharacterized protein (TIGR02001 family)
MKKTLLSLSIAAAAVTMPTQAADIGGGFDLSGNLALTSNYIWRGMTQSDDAEAIQGGLDLAHSSGLYVGTWASNTSGGSEFDYYAGYATEVSGIGVDVGAIAYRFPNDSDTAADGEDIYLGLSTEIGGLEIGATHYWGQDEAVDAWDVGVGTELAGFGLSLTYGDYENNGDYYSVGLSKELLSETWPLEVSISYVDFSADAANSDQENLVFTVAKSF